MEQHLDRIIPFVMVVIAIALLVFVPGAISLEFILRLAAIIVLIALVTSAVVGVFLLMRYGHYAPAVQRRKQKSYEPITAFAEDPDPDADYVLDDDGELQKSITKS